MKPSQSGIYMYVDFEDGATVGMDVDDADPLEVLGEGVVADNKPADADFFNAFDDDFDDTDIN